MRIIAGAVLAAACAALSAYGAATEPVVEPLKLPERPRVIVFAPHPDDETIAAGGLIQQLTHAHADVHVVFLTNGDGYPDAVRKELRIPAPSGADYVAFGRRRQREALEATHRLGVHRNAVHFLGFPDGGSISSGWTTGLATVPTSRRSPTRTARPTRTRSIPTSTTTARTSRRPSYACCATCDRR